MTIRYSTSLRNTLMTTAADGGLSMSEIFASATLSFYSGAQPDDPDDTPNGTKLLEITGATFGTSTDGSISKSGTLQSTVLADGTVQSFRLTGSGGESLDGSVGVSGDIRFLSHVWESGETREVTALSLTMPVEAD